ncbi:MAG: hypothetical protein ACF8PN_13215 [Phycisphaerales bacterium]
MVRWIQSKSANALATASVALVILACGVANARSGSSSAPSVDELNALIANGQAEVAVRAIVDDPRLYSADERREVYERALNARIGGGAEGAIVDLLLHAPPGVNDLRSAATLELVRLWRADPAPSVRDTRRRLRWFAELQSAIQPSPLDPETPVTLILLGLDAVDRVNRPEDLFELLDLADRIAPENRIWTSFRPTQQFKLYAAESFERRERYLDAIELYRRLIYETPERGDWFRRLLATAQIDRVFAIDRQAGARAAAQAASLLRKEFLSPDELSRFRLYEDQLRAEIANNARRARLPIELDGSLTLEPLPVAYTINDEIYLDSDATLTVKPGAVIQGGRMILEGGAVRLVGSPEAPIYLIGVTLTASPDLGGVIDGEYVHFRDCRWIPPGGGGVTLGIRLRDSYSANCRWWMDESMRVSWINSEFEACDVRLGPGAATENSEAAYDPTTIADRVGGGFVNCHFVDSVVDQGVALGAQSSVFVDCEMVWSVTRSIEAAAPVTNGFTPVGGVPAFVRRTAIWNDANAAVRFESVDPATTRNSTSIGRWVE